MKCKLPKTTIPAAFSKNPERVLLYVARVARVSLSLLKRIESAMHEHDAGSYKWKDGAITFDGSGALYVPCRKLRGGAVDLDELDARFEELKKQVDEELEKKGGANGGRNE